MEEIMKRKISLLLATVLVFSTVGNAAFAEDVPKDTETTVTESVKEGKVQELSIADAVKLATESDRGMWKIDDQIKKMRDMRRQGSSAKEMAVYVMEAPLAETAGMAPDYLDLILAKNNYYTKTADLKSKEIEKQRGMLLIGIEIETKKMYYDVLVAEKAIEINQAKLSKAEEQLRVVNLKFSNGSATKAEVLNGEMAVQQAKTDLDSATDDLNIAKLDLLNKLDLPLDTKIVLTEKELTYIPTSKIDLDAAIEKAKTDRPEILTAENDLEIQKIETHAYKAYYTSNLRQYKWAEEKLTDAELNVPQSYKDVELDVRNKYLNLVKAERALTNMDKTVELAKEAARINKLLYENGMVTSLDVLNADTDLAQAEIGKYQLLVAYNMSKLMFDNSNIMGVAGNAAAADAE
ncbi:MAG TPA: hypothetical protein DCM73_04515 [Clostridiales bacterium]|nr:hypothetical protein [Clostridiales bacterium]